MDSLALIGNPGYDDDVARDAINPRVRPLYISLLFNEADVQLALYYIKDARLGNVLVEY